MFDSDDYAIYYQIKILISFDACTLAIMLCGSLVNTSHVICEL